MEGDPPEVKGKRLLGATISGNLEFVEKFLRNGTDVNFSYEDTTALDIAADEGFEPIVNILLKYGAVIDHRHGSNGFTPLMSAAEKGHKGIVDSLIKAGADINCRLDEKCQMKEWTALHIALFNRQESVAECLLKAGAEVDCPDSEGNTPLHNVVRRGIIGLPHTFSMVKLLVKYGTDPSLKNNQNQSSLDIAESSQLTKVMKLLKQPKDAKRACIIE